MPIEQIYYFGCWSKIKVGHYLYDISGWVIRDSKSPLPKKMTSAQLDGGSVELKRTQIQNQASLAIIDNWTVVTFSDYTGDSRSGSHSSFIVEGVKTFEEVLKLASSTFSEQYKRITKMGPIIKHS